MQAELSESVLSSSVHSSDNTENHADVFDKTTKMQKIMRGKPYKGYKVMIFNFIMMIGLTCFVAKDMWDAHVLEYQKLNHAGHDLLKLIPEYTFTKQQYEAQEEAKRQAEAKKKAEEEAKKKAEEEAKRKAEEEARKKAEEANKNTTTTNSTKPNPTPTNTSSSTGTNTNTTHSET